MRDLFEPWFSSWIIYILFEVKLFGQYVLSIFSCSLFWLCADYSVIFHWLVQQERATEDITETNNNTIIKNISNVSPNKLCLKIGNGIWPQLCAYNVIDINKMRIIIQINRNTESQKTKINEAVRICHHKMPKPFDIGVKVS